jgi:hypothetical protein
MPLPHAHQVLWFLGIFLGLWALSVILRSPRRKPGGSTAAAAPAPVPTPTRPRPTLVSAQHSRRLGLALLPVSLAIVIAGSALRRWVFGDTLNDAWTFWDIAGLAGLVFAAILLTRALIGDRAKGRDRCPACWYDMSGSAAAGRLTCPECGHVSKTPADLRRARRSKPLIACAVVLALASLWIPRIHDARERGWKMLIPTAMLIALIDHAPEHWIVDTWPADDASTLSRRLADGETPAYLKRWAKERVKARYEHPASYEQFKRLRPLSLHLLTWPQVATPRQTEVLVQAVMSEDPSIASAAWNDLFHRRRELPSYREHLSLVAPLHADLIARRLHSDEFEEFFRALSLSSDAGMTENDLITICTRWIQKPSITMEQASRIVPMLAHHVASDPVIEATILRLPHQFDPLQRDEAWYSIAAIASYAKITPAIRDALLQRLSVSISHRLRWQIVWSLIQGPSADPATRAMLLAKAQSDPVYLRDTFDASTRNYVEDTGPAFDLRNHILTIALQSPDPGLLRDAVQYAAANRGSVARIDHVRDALRNLSTHPDPEIVKTAREIIDWYETPAEKPAEAPR